MNIYLGNVDTRPSRKVRLVSLSPPSPNTPRLTTFAKVSKCPRSSFSSLKLGKLRTFQELISEPTFQIWS